MGSANVAQGCLVSSLVFTLFSSVACDDEIGVFALVTPEDAAAESADAATARSQHGNDAAPSTDAAAAGDDVGPDAAARGEAEHDAAVGGDAGPDATARGDAEHDASVGDAAAAGDGAAASDAGASAVP